MAFSHQNPLSNGGLEDDLNQSFDASSYINDDGDSPEPFDSLDADPLSSESDNGVHDVMVDMEGDTSLNHFLNHAGSGNPGAITFVSDDLTDHGAPFGHDLTGLTPDMNMAGVQSSNSNYNLSTISMGAVDSGRPDHDMHSLEDNSASNEDVETADVTPRASKISSKSGTRSVDHQRYAAAMQQHHHVNGNTPYTTSIPPGKTLDGVLQILPPAPLMAGDTARDLRTNQQTTSARDGTSSSPPLFSLIPVKNEPAEAGTNIVMATGPAAHATTGVSLQIQPFDQSDAENGQDDDEEEAIGPGANSLLDIQGRPSAGERSSDSSVPEGRKKKRKGKGKANESSSGIEIDDTENAELDAAGDGDGDDENARRKIKIEYIEDKSRRHITFSKRKAGIMKKAYELSILTGTQVLLLVVSETGLCYTYTTPKMSPMVTQPAGQQLIQACLNAPEGYGPDGEVLKVPSAPSGSKKDKNELAIRPLKLNAEELANLAAASASASDPVTPKKKKQGKPTLDGKEGKPGGAAAAQSRRRASDKVKRAASGASKKGARVTSEGNTAASASGPSYNEHDMDASQQPPPIPAIPTNVRRLPSNTPVTLDRNGNNPSILMQHNPQPDIQPGVSLVSPISAAFPTSQRLPPQHHQHHHQHQQNDYPEYNTHQAQATGPHYYQAQNIPVSQSQQPQPGSMVPMQINYSYPTQATQYIDPSPALHPQQMQRQHSQAQSMPQTPHSAESHPNPHQHYVQNLADTQHYASNQPRPSQMLAGSISMGGQI